MRMMRWLVLALGLAMLLSTAAQAASVDLTTSPLPISLGAAPGSTVSTDIRIKNNSQTQPIKVSLMKFSAYGDTGKPALKDRGPGDDYFDWVSFSPGSFAAPTGQWQTVKMTIKIPSDGAFGYYYAVVFTPADAKPTGKGNVLLGSTAVLVLLDVQNPHAKRSIQIDSFTADKRFYEFLPADFKIKFHNNGNVHVQPHGNIFISRGGKQIASLVFNSQQGNVLPGTNRIYDVAWSDGFPVYAEKVKDGQTVLDKQGKPITDLKWDWSKFSKLRFGHYTAHLTAVYDNGRQDVPVEASVSFWVVPIRLILLIIAIPLIPSLLVYWLTKRRMNKRLAKKGADVKA